ncbi:MAG: hypothetical protein WD689_04515 [Gaiellaceae bacterium]
MGLFVALRPADEAEPTPPVPATTAETGTPEVATTEPTPPPPPPVATLRATIRDGRPRGGIQRLTVERRERVRIVVRSDVADHVHVHGYDLMRDVAPGRQATIGFRATIVGRFEIELEDSGVLIAELEVRP